MTRLSLFGAIHFDRRKKVAEELSRFSNGVDVLFIEYPVDDLTFRGMVWSLLRAPTSMIGMFIVVLFEMMGYAILNRSLLPAEVIAARKLHEDYDIPLYQIDDHPVTLLGRVSVLRTVIEWALLLTLVAIDPIFSVFTILVVLEVWLVLIFVHSFHRLLWAVAVIPTVVGACWYLWVRGAVGWPLVVVAVSAFYYTAIRTLHHRNEVMIKRIETYCEEEGYERACLTTGYLHLSGLAAVAEGYQVEVVDSYVPRWLREGTVVNGSVDD